MSEEFHRRHEDIHPPVVDKKSPWLTLGVFLFGLVCQTIYFTWTTSATITEFTTRYNEQMREMRRDIEENKKAIAAFTVLNNRMIAVEVTVNNMRDTLESIDSRLNGGAPRPKRHSTYKP